MGDVYRASQDVVCVLRATLRWGRDESGVTSGVFLPDENGPHTFRINDEIRAEAPTAGEAQAKLDRLLRGYLDRGTKCGLVGEPSIEKVVTFWERVAKAMSDWR